MLVHATFLRGGAGLLVRPDQRLDAGVGQRPLGKAPLSGCELIDLSTIFHVALRCRRS